RARPARRFLQVRAAPANAPQPWLPLHDLQIRYQSTPQELRAGSAATLTVEVTADAGTPVATDRWRAGVRRTGAGRRALRRRSTARQADAGVRAGAGARR